MSATYSDLVSYLTSEGWTKQNEGSDGSVWTRANFSTPLPVLNGLDTSAYEWRSTIDRIAGIVGRDAASIDRDISRMYVDVQEFRAAGDIHIKGSIPLEAGFSLFSSVRSMIRAAAASARYPRMRVGGTPSPAAMRAISKARFGHTIEGSYIVPLLMPLEAPPEPVASTLDLRRSAVEHEYIEPEERRASKTLAQALTALRRGVVEPDRVPSGDTLAHLVASGVSRELILAIERILTAEGVSILAVDFDWAGAFEVPHGDLQAVEIPQQSLDLLQRTADRFVADSKDPYERLSGRIIDLGDDPDMFGGRIVIRVLRRGRQTRIEVPLTDEQTEAAHGWFHDHREVHVAGLLKPVIGGITRVDKVIELAPLDEVALFTQQATDASDAGS